MKKITTFCLMLLLTVSFVGLPMNTRAEENQATATDATVKREMLRQKMQERLEKIREKSLKRIEAIRQKVEKREQKIEAKIEKVEKKTDEKRSRLERKLEKREQRIQKTEEWINTQKTKRDAKTE